MCVTDLIDHMTTESNKIYAAADMEDRFLVPRVAPATLGAGAGGGAPPSSSPSHFTEHDIYDQELG